jgi:DNA-binding NtrC family response regulator
MSLVLIWQERAALRDSLVETLQEDEREVEIVATAGEVREFLARENCDLLVMAFEPEELVRIHGDHPALPVLVVGENLGSSEAIAVVQAGAFDSLAWPCSVEDLRASASEALAAAREEEAVTALPNANPASDEDLVGMSRAMGMVYREIAKLAATPVTVLIRGETGTGKELVAQALWQHGHRAHHKLVVVNCAAIPENLLESELFGYEKGAFTGAHAPRKGKFEQAHGGTLFLDEIGDMGVALQAKMLRVLQEKRIERVGGRGEIAVDVRVIAATHQPLEKMVAEGTFREDLLYRLQGASLTLPPLRDRLGDVELLSRHFLHKYSEELSLEGRISKEAISYLARQSWPGNVRQLQNVLRRALLKRRELVIGREDLRELIQQSHQSADSREGSDLTLAGLADQVLEDAELRGEGSALREAVTELEKVVIREALRRTGGNQSKAARWLGITRLTLREKIKTLPSS